MDNLPVELCITICSHIDSNTSLKALSIQSRRWAAATRPVLFKVMHLRLWPECVERFEEQLDQPLFRAHARELHLHMPHRPELDNPGDFVVFLQNESGSSNAGKRDAIGFPYEPWREEFGEQWKLPPLNEDDADEEPEMAWNDYYMQYRVEMDASIKAEEMIIDQKFWDRVKDILGKQLRRFVVDGADIWTGLAECWTLLENNTSPPRDRIDYGFCHISGAIAKSKVLEHVAHVEFLGLFAEFFSNNLPDFENTAHGLVGYADYVDISLASGTYAEQENMPNVHCERIWHHMMRSTLADAMKATCKGFSVEWASVELYQGRMIRADIPLALSYNCRTLRRLSLSAFTLTFGIVIVLLDHVRGTLECLEFQDIQMWMYGDHVPGGDDTPRGFFCELVKHHKLKEASFKGMFAMEHKRYFLNRSFVGTEFEKRHKDEKTRFGEQIARAVVVQPRHRCIWSADEEWKRTKIPTKEQRINWITRAFDEADEHIAVRKAIWQAEQKAKAEAEVNEGGEDEIEKEELDSEGEEDEDGEWEDVDSDEEDEEDEGADQDASIEPKHKAGPAESTQSPYSLRSEVK